MKMLLNICKNTHLTEKKYEYLFLLLNTLAWCAIGFVVWAVVSIFAFRGTESVSYTHLTLPTNSRV